MTGYGLKSEALATEFTLILLADSVSRSAIEAFDLFGRG